MVKVKNYAIFASGTGTNALALINKGKQLGNPPRIVIVNREDSPLLVEVAKLGVECRYIPSTVKGVDSDFERNAVLACDEFSVDTLLLAGFMKILSAEFLNHFSNGMFNQVINIHPSLLPKYPGLSGYEKAYKNNDSEYGHTIHLVTEGVDEGPILIQVKLKPVSGESIDDFIGRGKDCENQSYANFLESILRKGIEYVEL